MAKLDREHCRRAEALRSIGIRGVRRRESGLLGEWWNPGRQVWMFLMRRDQNLRLLQLEI
jgi:hypothetical protein